MLNGSDNGHAWTRAPVEQRQALCEELGRRLGRDADFLRAAIDRLCQTGDANLLANSIEEMARVSLAAMHLRPQQS